MKLKRILFITFLIFHLNFSVYAQTFQELERPRHEVFVTLKLLDVFVTDKKGEPVRDLSVEDFVVLDNKVNIPISYFERIEIEYEKELQTHPTENKIRDRIEREARRKFLLFFDFLNNTGRGIDRAKKAALHFIDAHVHPSDLISVIFCSLSRGLIVKEFMADNHLRVKNKIEKIQLKELAGSSSRFEDLEEGLVSFREFLPEEKQGDWERFRENVKRMEIRTFSNLMMNFARILRHIPGTKHIVFFSVGPDSNFIYGSGEFKDEYESMIKEFASSNCVIYSINTEGIPDVFIQPWEKGEQALLRLSQVTGGKYYPNTEDLRPAMEDIAKRTSFYYVLGIPVKEEMDGKFHKIEVKVKRKGVKVHAPTGYYNPKPFKEYTDFEKFLHLVDSALSEKPLLQEVKEFPLSLNPVDSEKNIFEIFFEISTKELLEGDEGIEVVIIFFDSKREIIKVKREKVGDISNAERFTYKRVIELPSNTEEVRVVMRNLSTGRSLRGIAKKG